MPRARRGHLRADRARQHRQEHGAVPAAACLGQHQIHLSEKRHAPEINMSQIGVGEITEGILKGADRSGDTCSGGVPREQPGSQRSRQRRIDCFDHHRQHRGEHDLDGAIANVSDVAGEVAGEVEVAGGRSCRVGRWTR